MKHKLLALCLWAAIFLAAASLTACIADEGMADECPEPEVPTETDNVIIGFRMALSNNGIPIVHGGGGSVDVPLGHTPGTSRENAVNSIDLLVFDADNDRLADHVVLTQEQIAQIVAPNTLYVPIYAPSARRVRIYAAVNMTPAMRSRFVYGELQSSMTLTSTHSNYWDVIDEFVPGSAGRQEQLETSGTGIPMTGQFFITDTPNGVIELDDRHTSIESALQVKAEVGRMVAKIHVLASAQSFTLSDGSQVDYAHAQDRSMLQNGGRAGDYTNWIGWIRLGNIRYMPNATNRSTYLFPQASGNVNYYPLWKDLNMDLSSYIIGGQFDAPTWNRDYVFYSGVSLHRENISSSSHLAHVEAFSQERLDKTNGTNDPGRYTRGMYCLENYFNTSNEAMLQSYKDAIPMITHVSIAAKLTPRNIVVVSDFAASMDNFVLEYQNNPDKFRRDYGLEPQDFTAADVARWAVIKSRYFTGELPLYRGFYHIVETLTEADTQDIVNWSLKHNKLWSPDANDFENNKYPDDTFYVYDTRNDGSLPAADQTYEMRYLYLTAGAVNRSTDDNARIKTYSVPHLGGWGYYYTYLDQTGSSVNNKTPYNASQVTRNTYYLITVDNFGVPGGTITRPEYIKVNTVPVGWDYSGKGDINLH